MAYISYKAHWILIGISVGLLSDILLFLSAHVQVGYGLGLATGLVALSCAVGIVLYCFIYARTGCQSQATFLEVYVSQILDGKDYEKR